MMKPIFISYRREDSADVTGRINDQLRAVFGNESVYLDVDNIPYGVDYRVHLDQQVAKCDVFFVVIGKDWLTVDDAKGQSRLEDPGDVVRIEIESALKRDIRIVPLLVRGTEMPSAQKLPESIQELAYRNGIPIRPDPDFHQDIGRLTDWLKQHLRELEEARQREALTTHRAALDERAKMAARQAEDVRLAEEAREAEAARLAKDARKAEEAREAEAAQQAEDARKAEEARLAEEARKAEKAREVADKEREFERTGAVRATSTQSAQVANLRRAAESIAAVSHSKAFKQRAGVVLAASALLAIAAVWYLTAPRDPVGETLGTVAAEAQLPIVEESQALGVAGTQVPAAEEAPAEAEQAETIIAEETLVSEAGETQVPAPDEIQALPAAESAAPIVEATQELASEQVPSPVEFLLPDMVEIPGGTFMMGSAASQSAISQFQPDDVPQHTVTIAAFAMGMTEVTFNQYDQFAAATGRELPSDEGWGRGERPVINVSWANAVAYAEWLSENTGDSYRLPTEAEWEYAARGGADTTYWWGDNRPRPRSPDLPGPPRPGDIVANCDGCGSLFDGSLSAPVASFAPNPFGLHDTAGNVWEWLQDCYVNTYVGAPIDGSAREQPDCTLRGIRGGAWSYRPEVLRSSYRGRTAPDNRTNTIGFRIARDL